MSTKRKRPEDPAENAPNHNATTRRTTRHTTVQPPLHPPPITTVPVPLPPQYTQLQTAFNPPAPIGRGPSSNQPPTPRQPQLPPPQVLRWAPPEVTGPTKPSHAAAMGSIATKYNSRPSDLVAPEITYHVPQTTHPAQRTSALVRPHGPTVQPPRLDRGPLPIITPVFPPRPPAPVPDRPPVRADRNIDKVVFGNICFRTWYPSYYGKEVLGDHSGATRGGSKDGGKDTGGKSASKKEREHHTMLERLYVCPHCFKYSKELVAWWGHVQVCEKLRYIPGRKIYIHPRGRRKILVPAENRGAGPKKRRGEGGVRYVEEIVQDEGEWSIWEVDGEKDGVSQIQSGNQRLSKSNANF